MARSSRSMIGECRRAFPIGLALLWEAMGSYGKLWEAMGRTWAGDFDQAWRANATLMASAAAPIVLRRLQVHDRNMRAPQPM